MLATITYVTRKVEASSSHSHSTFWLIIILIVIWSLVLFLRSCPYPRFIKFLVFDEWKNLPIIRSFIEARALHRLKIRAQSIPFSEIHPRHIQVMDLERLAEYIVWLIRETNGIPKERTVEETLAMLREAKSKGYLDAVRRVLYYDWERRPPRDLMTHPSS